jgi:F-box protein 21
VLDYVHRSEALAEWCRLARGEAVSLERALGSFDLFVLHDNHGDLLEVWPRHCVDQFYKS